ncbi:MAG: class I SAM-dependent methyltransferase [Candidatus Kapaibacterium sp.]
MHYKIKSTIVKSEKAARSTSQQGKFVLDWISKLNKELCVLDYGCGLFRYTAPLSEIVGKVIAIDSKEQLEKVHKFRNDKLLLKEYNKKYLHNVDLFSLEDLKWKKIKYDVVFCSNVLSAIPNFKSRSTILENSFEVLKRNGKLFIFNQFKNSYFNSFKDNPKAEKYLDGWLIKGEKTSTFYGLIDKSSLENICVNAGFNIEESYVKGESAYVLANKSLAAR